MKMRRDDYQQPRQVVVDLSGPEGNVFQIWALMMQLTKYKTPKEIKEAEADLALAIKKAKGAARLSGKPYDDPNTRNKRSDNIFIEISRHGINKSYEEVIETLEKYFGDYVLILTDDEEE